MWSTWVSVRTGDMLFSRLLLHLLVLERCKDLPIVGITEPAPTGE